MKAKVSIGFYNLPIVRTNFMTGENGENDIVAKYMEFCQDVYREVNDKLVEAARAYFPPLGVSVEALTAAQVQDYTNQLAGKQCPNKITTRVLNAEGKVIDDEHAVQAVISGKRLDN